MTTGLQVIHIEKRITISSGLNRHITRQQFVTVGENRIVEVWVPGNADSSKTEYNVELVSREFIDSQGQKYDLTLQQAVDKRILEAEIKPRKGQATCLEIIFSGSHDVMAAMSKAELKKWADDTLEWAQNTWGKENVVSASLHVDERTPHIHMIVVPIVTGQSRRTRNYKMKAERRGKATKSYNIDHKKLRLCVNEVYTTGKLYEYHDNYAKEVSQKYGLDRGVKAEPGSKKKHTNSIEYNRMLAKQATELQALIEELKSDYAEKEAEIQEDILQLQVKRDTLSSAVEEEEEKKKEAERKAKEAEVRLSFQDELINKNRSLINQQNDDICLRNRELKQTKTDIAANKKIISEQNDEIAKNQDYLQELESINEEIARRKKELKELSSLSFLKMLMALYNMVIAEIQERIKGYWKGNVKSYEEVKHAVGAEPAEDFAKIYINYEGRDYYIEVSETTGKVYLEGDTKPIIYKNTGKEMTMPELAEYFKAELTPEAKHFAKSLFKPTQTQKRKDQSKKILGQSKKVRIKPHL